MNIYKFCSPIRELSSSLRRSVIIRVVREGLRAYRSELGAEEKTLSCYISCAENDKGVANDCAKLLNQSGFRCIVSSNLEQGAGNAVSRAKSFAEADKCLVIMTAEYLQELKKKGSNVARDYDLILNEFSTIPESKKVISLPLENASLDIPDCLRARSGISLVELLHYWGRHLVNYLAYMALRSLMEYSVSSLVQYFVPDMVGPFAQIIEDYLVHYLVALLFRIYKVHKFVV